MSTPKTVVGGTVYRVGQTQSLAASVEKIVFATVDSSQSVPDGAVGTLYLVNPPPQIGHYDVGNVLNYQDSNHNNDCQLTVLINYGPSKYSVRKN